VRYYYPPMSLVIVVRRSPLRSTPEKARHAGLDTVDQRFLSPISSIISVVSVVIGTTEHPVRSASSPRLYLGFPRVVR